MAEITNNNAISLWALAHVGRLDLNSLQLVNCS